MSILHGIMDATHILACLWKKAANRVWYAMVESHYSGNGLPFSII
ncbi:hypothetical protein C8D96_0724 [Kushneria marisflavi]|nr:hypothetical protein C8D96_0724 [Kushneria marisflavi]